MDRLDKTNVRVFDLGEYDEAEENLKFWLSKSPVERVSAVEILRRQQRGSAARLQRVVRVVELSQS